MYALRAQVDKMYQEGLEAEREGKPVAWCMLEPFAPPIFEAIGVKSIFPENYGTVCASTGSAGSFLQRAEVEGFPAHLCGYARNCLGYSARMMDLGGGIPPESPQGGMPKPVLLLASGMLCDARFKWFQALGRYFDVPLYTLESPALGARESLTEGTYERSVNFMVEELREFVAFLEHLLDKKMDWDKLGEDVDRTMEMDRVWYGVANGLRKARPGPMHSRDFWSSMPSARYMDPKIVTDLYRNLYDEVKYRVENKVASINREEQYRLVFIGLPPWHSLGFFDQLAERGWNFVFEQAYHPPRPIDLSKVSDPLERLVRYRYQGLAGIIDFDFEPGEAAEIKQEIKQRGFSPRLSSRMVRDYQCDGAVLHTLLTCRGTSAPQNLLGSQFMEVWQVPSLVIEGDIVDLTLFDPADALRKAEVFEEIMNHYQRVRKEAGLEW